MRVNFCLRSSDDSTFIFSALFIFSDVKLNSSVGHSNYRLGLRDFTFLPLSGFIVSKLFFFYQNFFSGLSGSSGTFCSISCSS